MELKPCPFCGQEAFLEICEDHHGVFYQLGCTRNGCPAYSIYYAMSPEDITVDDAMAQWNSRDGVVSVEDSLILRNVFLKFTSGNQIPIERAVITAAEWDVIKGFLPPAPEGE